jgi:hypothetical protein
VDEARDRNIHGARPIRPSSADPQPLRFDNVAWRSLVVATLTSRFSAAPPRVIKGDAGSLTVASKMSRMAHCALE